MAVTRGNKRRSLPEQEGEEDTRLLDPQEATAALEEAALVRSTRNKRKRLEAWTRLHPEFEIILADVYPLIMSFLDDPLDVYNLSKCSKYFHDAVTTDIVVRSAVFCPNETIRRIIGYVMFLVENKAIHTPSTWRLLRLLCAQRCECMENCYAYNLTTKTSAKLRGSHRPYGLAICSHCITGLSFSNAFPWRSPVGDLDELATTNGNRLVTALRSEAVTGDPVGPYIVAAKVRQVIHTFHEHDKRVSAIKKLHGELTAALDDGARENMVQLYNSAEAQYPEFAESRERIAIEKARAKYDKWAAKKKGAVKSVISQIEKLLGGYGRKDLALEGRYDDAGVSFTLRWGPVNEVLGKFLSAPSTASQKKLIAAAAEVRIVFDLMVKYRFTSDTRKALPLEGRPGYKKSLLLYCAGKQALFEASNWREQYWTKRPFNEFVLLLKSGQLEGALATLMNPDQFKEAFADYVSFSESNREKGKLYKFAKLVGDFSDVQGSLAEYRTAFNERLRSFKQLKATAYAYLASVGVANFLDETGLPGGRRYIPLEAFTRRDAVELILTDLDDVQKCLLQSGNYEILLAYHRECFAAGRKVYQSVYQPRIRALPRSVAFA